MTRIALVRFASGQHDRETFARDRSEFLAPLRREFELLEIQPGRKAPFDLQVAFIASGGCEQEFRRHFPRLDRPVILLADGLHNSLPAALEIASWVREQGETAEIVYGDCRVIALRLRELALFENARRALAGPIGVIGKPSDWLIGSGVDRAVVSQRWGTKFIDIGMAELTRRRSSAGTAAIARAILAEAQGLDGIREKAVAEAAQLIPALRALFVRHRLRAATLRCFRLFETLGSGGCLALSRLNDEGRICGCEGDVPAAFTMLLLHSLTGEAPFMANPAAVDLERNCILLAHCTVPSRAVKSYRLQTHFETGRSVAVCGAFVSGPATVFKVGGPDLGSYFVTAAKVLPQRIQPGLCRTQVRLQLREPAAYFLNAALANHHVLAHGDHSRRIIDFMHYCGARRIQG